MGAACRRLLATWRPLATYWRLLATTGDRWLPVRAHPHTAFSLATTGDHWRPLATTGNLATGDHWRLGNLLATYWRLSLATWQPRAQDSYKTVPFIIVVCFPKLFTDYTKITLVHLTLICEQHRQLDRQLPDRHSTGTGHHSTAREPDMPDMPDMLDKSRQDTHIGAVRTARQRPDRGPTAPDTIPTQAPDTRPDISPT